MNDLISAQCGSSDTSPEGVAKFPHGCVEMFHEYHRV